MDTNSRVCPGCNASNKPKAEWCSQCFTPFDVLQPVVETQPQVDVVAAIWQRAPSPMTMTPALTQTLTPSRKANVSPWRYLRLGLIVLIFSARFINVGGASGAVEGVQLGSFDPRGFQTLYVDASTYEPVRFNACSPIHYVINPANAPAEGIADAQRAFDELSAAMGVEFVYDGETTEEYSMQHEPYQPDRYGDRWAPILISWSGEALPVASPTEGHTVIGLGAGDIKQNADGRAVLVSGSARFDGTYEMNSGFGGETWGQVMLHELGHVVGLDHVNDETSIMNPTAGLRPAAFGAGDRAGLWELGAGSNCVKTPEV